MDNPICLPREPTIYDNLRRDFVESVAKPTIQELAAKHNVPVSTVYRKASEEQWNELRVAHLQFLEQKSDATSIVLQAAQRTDAHVMRAFSDVLIVGLEQLSRAISEIKCDLAASTRVNILKEASFAFLNFANGGRQLGFVTFDKNVERLGKEDNGRWDPKLLSQINVTVQNLTGKAEATTATVDAKPESIPEPSPTS